jgi:hypothetical protein
MIFFTGLGSFISDRVPIERRRLWLTLIPLAIAATLMAMTLSIQPVIDATVQFDLLVRGLIVIVMAAPVSLLLGFCFPLGMRLVGRISDGATAWMWGINGVCGVLGSVLAVVLSLWTGIHTSLYVAAALYLILLVPANVLLSRGRATTAS